jgi:hypothetical protein
VIGKCCEPKDSKYNQVDRPEDPDKLAWLAAGFAVAPRLEQDWNRNGRERRELDDEDDGLGGGIRMISTEDRRRNAQDRDPDRHEPTGDNSAPPEARRTHGPAAFDVATDEQHHQQSEHGRSEGCEDEDTRHRHRPAATIICSKQIAMIEAFMKKEKAGFCGCQTQGTSSVKSNFGCRTCRSVTGRLLEEQCYSVAFRVISDCCRLMRMSQGLMRRQQTGRTAKCECPPYSDTRTRLSLIGGQSD